MPRERRRTGISRSSVCGPFPVFSRVARRLFRVRQALSVTRVQAAQRPLHGLPQRHVARTTSRLSAFASMRGRTYTAAEVAGRAPGRGHQRNAWRAISSGPRIRSASRSTGRSKTRTPSSSASFPMRSRRACASWDRRRLSADARARLAAKLLVRSAGPPEALVPALRSALHPLDPRARLDRHPGERRACSSRVGEPRALATLAGALAVIALALAVVGHLRCHRVCRRPADARDRPPDGTWRERARRHAVAARRRPSASDHRAGRRASCWRLSPAGCLPACCSACNPPIRSPSLGDSRAGHRCRMRRHPSNPARVKGRSGGGPPPAVTPYPRRPGSVTPSQQLDPSRALLPRRRRLADERAERSRRVAEQPRLPLDGLGRRLQALGLEERVHVLEVVDRQSGMYWSDCFSHASRSLPPYTIGRPSARAQACAVDSPVCASGPTRS